MSLGARETVHTFASTDAPTSVTTDGSDLFAGDNSGPIYRIQTLASPATRTVLTAATSLRDPEYVTFHNGQMYAVQTFYWDATMPAGVYAIDSSTGAPSLVCDVSAVAGTDVEVWGVAIRPADDSFWVAGFFSPALYHFDSTGAHVATYTHPSYYGLGGGEWSGDVLYMAAQSSTGVGAVVSFDPAGSAFSTLLAGLNGSPDDWKRRAEDIAINGGRIFGSVRRGGGSPTYIWSCDMTGADLRLEYSHPNGASGTQGALGITVIGSYLYGAYTGSAAIYRWPISASVLRRPTVGRIGFR